MKKQITYLQKYFSLIKQKSEIFLPFFQYALFQNHQDLNYYNQFYEAQKQISDILFNY